MERSSRRGHPGLQLGLGCLLLLALALKSGLLLLISLLLLCTGATVVLWGRYALHRVAYTRSLSRTRCFPGEEVELTVELVNRKALPVTYLAVDDQVPDDLKVGSRTLPFARAGRGTLSLLFGLSWYQKVIRHYRLVPMRRGYYELGPARLRGGDPFGYVTDVREVPDLAALVVYPRVVALEQLGLPSRRPFGDLLSRDWLFEDPLLFAGVREYRPGDAPSRVHWKASAATGKMQVKVLDPSSNMGLAVFLNTWSYDYFWQGADMTALETGCSVAASIANWAAEVGRPVGVYANGLLHTWGPSLRIPPATGATLLPQVLEGLARIQAPGREAIETLLLEEAMQLSYGTTIVVITRLVTSGLESALHKVRRSGRPVTLVLVGRAEAALQGLPGIRVYRVPEEEALHAGALA